MTSSKIGDNTESCYGSIEYRAVQLSQNVSASTVARDDYEWPNVARPHLAIEGLFDSCIASKDEIARFARIIDKGSGMIFLEPLSSVNSGLVRAGMNKL